MNTTMKELWDQYREDILRYLTRRVRDPEVARDLTQEIFVQLLQTQEQLANVQHIDRWIFRLARNKLIDHTRKRTEIPLEQAERIAGEGHATSDAFIRSISSCVGNLISKYGDGDAELFLSIFSGELSQKEAAHVVRVPYSTMKSRVQKVRSRVVEHFAGECCRLIHNSKGRIISCAPLTTDAKACC